MGSEEVIAGKRMGPVGCPMEVLQEGLYWIKGTHYCTCCPADGAITLYNFPTQRKHIGKLRREIGPQRENRDIAFLLTLSSLSKHIFSPPLN